MPVSTSDTTSASLPVINLDCYLDEAADPSERSSKASTLRTTLRDIGFFYLDVSNYLTQQEMEDVLRAGRDFFARPVEEKEAIAIDSPQGDGSRGYQRLKQNITKGKVDHHEGLDLYAPSLWPFDPDVKAPLTGANQWPVDSEQLQASLRNWEEKMKVLGLAVMEAISDALEMTSEEWQDLRAMLLDPFWVMRVIGYPPLPSDAEGISCGEHKDYGCLTFLHTDSTKGALQVLKRKTHEEGGTDATADEGEWITADPLPGCFVVNVGEMIELWTAGLFRATLHRVNHASSTYRVSLPFFFEPSFTAQVAPLPAANRILKKEGRPVGQYRPTQYGDFLLGKVGANFIQGGKKEKY